MPQGHSTQIDFEMEKPKAGLEREARVAPSQHSLTAMIVWPSYLNNCLWCDGFGCLSESKQAKT